MACKAKFTCHTITVVTHFGISTGVADSLGRNFVILIVDCLDKWTIKKHENGKELGLKPWYVM